MLARGCLLARSSISLTCGLRCSSDNSKQLKQYLHAPKQLLRSFVSFNFTQFPLALPSLQRCINSKSSQSSKLSTKPSDTSLFAELFPEDIQRKQASQTLRKDTNATVPPSRLPINKGLLDGVDLSRLSHHFHAKETSKTASSDAYKNKKIAVLVLGLTSKSLIECDFRRIAPKGTHLDGWTGPGDILAVFPARDPTTFEQSDHYFVVFANPAYARAYQSHVHRLYRLAKKHTPTSIESPLPPQPGVKINNEDACAMIQDFTLCPPSQRMHFKYIYDTLSPSMRDLLDRGGYLRFPDGTSRAGRAVRFWVDGHQLTSREVSSILASDGRNRGMAWDLSMCKLDASTLDASLAEDLKFSDTFNSAETIPPARASHKWILTFRNETEARRFIRGWHRRQLASQYPDEPRIVQAEYLW